MHLKVVNQPGADLNPIVQELSDAQQLYFKAEVGISLASIERIDVPGMDEVEVGSCPAARKHELTTEQAKLFEHRNFVRPSEIVIYVVKGIVASRDGVLGCANHPAGRPGLIMRHTPTNRWTMAHELGHVLGLSHPDCIFEQCLPWHDNLMWPDDSKLSKPQPDLTATQKAIMYLSPYTNS